MLGSDDWLARTVALRTLAQPFAFCGVESFGIGADLVRSEYLFAETRCYV